MGQQIRDASETAEEAAHASKFKFSEVKVEPFRKQILRSLSKDGPSHGGFGGYGGRGYGGYPSSRGHQGVQQRNTKQGSMWKKWRSWW